jgi:hypothetical protein
VQLGNFIIAIFSPWSSILGGINTVLAIGLLFVDGCIYIRSRKFTYVMLGMIPLCGTYGVINAILSDVWLAGFWVFMLFAVAYVYWGIIK